MNNIENVLFETLKNDEDFVNLYASYKGNLEGFEDYFKSTIENFVGDFKIYLDKPYIDISYIKLKDNSLIDIDLLWNIFKNGLEELDEERDLSTNSAYSFYIDNINKFDEIEMILRKHDNAVGSSNPNDYLHGWFYTLINEIKEVKEKGYVNFWRKFIVPKRYKPTR